MEQDFLGLSSDFKRIRPSTLQGINFHISFETQVLSSSHSSRKYCQLNQNIHE